MMRRPLFLVCLLTAALILTACGSRSPSGFGANNGGSGNGFRSFSGRNTTLSPEAKLALGTLKLEGTKAAVDPRMAAKLIPLWQLLGQLDSSTSAAPQEVNAVLDAIHATMAPEQLTAINSMTLSGADIFAVLQQDSQASGAGGTSGGGAGAFGRNRGNGGNGGFFFVGGGPGPAGGPGGGFGGAGFRNNNGGTSTTSQASAEQAAQATQARERAISTLVINQLVRLLETKLSR